MRAGATRRRIVGLTAAIGAMLLTLSACAAGQAISLEVPEQSEAPFAPEMALDSVMRSAAVQHVQGVAALVLACKQVAHIAAGGSAQKLAFGL